MGHFLLIILNKDTYGMKLFYYIADRSGLDGIKSLRDSSNKRKTEQFKNVV